jgi:hypothetical protein
MGGCVAHRDALVTLLSANYPHVRKRDTAKSINEDVEVKDKLNKKKKKKKKGETLRVTMLVAKEVAAMKASHTGRVWEEVRGEEERSSPGGSRLWVNFEIII